MPPQYLISEIRQRTSASWTLQFTLADPGNPNAYRPGDPINDHTQQWPENRERVIAGRLELAELYEDQASVDHLIFDPTNVVPGIELSDDPILHLRSAVYAVSLERRIVETRPPIVNE